MAIVIRCPDCSCKLRVNDNLVGKAVQCPKCKGTFTAKAIEDAPKPPMKPATPASADLPSLSFGDEPAPSLEMRTDTAAPDLPSLPDESPPATPPEDDLFAGMMTKPKKTSPPEPAKAKAKPPAEPEPAKAQVADDVDLFAGSVVKSRTAQSVRAKKPEPTPPPSDDLFAGTDADVPKPTSRRKEQFDDVEVEDEERPSRRRRFDDDDEDRPSRRRRRDDDDDDDFDDRPRRGYAGEKPGEVTSAGMMQLVGGILALLTAAGFGLIGVSGGICCLPGALYGLVAGIMACVSGSQLLGQHAHRQQAPTHICVMQILLILNFDVINLILGIVGLTMLGSPNVRRYFRP